MKLLACKHASSTSSITQSADIGRQFAILKASNKTTTATNLPNGFGLKGFISDTFDKLNANGVLHLKLPARKAIIDHCVCCPEMFGKAMSPKTTKKGFIENGMIDSKTHTYPDLTMLLRTCKSEFTQEHEDLFFKNFSKLYTAMKTDGHIKEELYDAIGFPSDTNYAGETVEKPDNIRQEMRHRAKILSHSLQCSLRASKENEALSVVRKKQDDELILQNGLHKRNDEATNILFPVPSEAGNNYTDLPIQAFKKIHVNELKAFIHVRLFESATIPTGKASSIPKLKGKIEAAIAGVPNLIRVAYDSRALPIILPCPDTDAHGNVILLNDDDDGGGGGGGGDNCDDDGVDNCDVDEEDICIGGSNDDEAPPRLIVECVPPQSSETNHQPSYYLSRPSYLLIADQSIRGTLRLEDSLITDRDIQHVDKLGRIMRRRLANHIQMKIVDQSKHNHPALLFVRANLPRFAALSVYYRHARKSPMMNPNSCLLEQPKRGGFLAAFDAQLEGSYLHYSNEDCTWIRSGKAVGSNSSNPINGLVFRNEKGHSKKAVSSSLVDGECFYTLYPSRLNTNQLPNRMGHFEDLTQYCGFSFNRSEDVDGLISTDEDKGLFDWSMYISQIDKSNIQQCQTLREKQLVVVGYFFELCYDICLSPKHNVSNNPGFESILGVFNNAK